MNNSSKNVKIPWASPVKPIREKSVVVSAIFAKLPTKSKPVPRPGNE